DAGAGRRRRGMTRPGHAMSRRTFAAAAASALGAVAAGGAPLLARPRAANDGRLSARPRRAAATTLRSGALGLGSGGRDGIIQLPTTGADGPLPLLLYLHGASGTGERALGRISPIADDAGIAVVAPDSRGRTWDAVGGGFGDD